MTRPPRSGTGPEARQQGRETRDRLVTHALRLIDERPGVWARESLGRYLSRAHKLYLPKVLLVLDEAPELESRGSHVRRRVLPRSRHELPSTVTSWATIADDLTLYRLFVVDGERVVVSRGARGLPD